MEALREELTLSDLASKYDIHPDQISHWKRQAADNMVDVFSTQRSRQADARDRELKELHAKVGRPWRMIFYHKPSADQSGAAEGNDHPVRTAVHRPAVRPTEYQPVVLVSCWQW